MRWLLIPTLLTIFSTQIFGGALVKRSLAQSFSSNPIFQRVFNGANPGASLASKFLQNPPASFSPASNVVVYYNSDEISSDEGADSGDSINSNEVEDHEEKGGEGTTTTSQESSSVFTTGMLYSSEITTPRDQIFNAHGGGITTTEENPVTLFSYPTTQSTNIVPSDFSSGPETFTTSTQWISTPPVSTVSSINNNDSIPTSTTLPSTITSKLPERSFSPTVSTRKSTQAGTFPTTEPGNEAIPLTSQTLDYQVATTTGSPHWSPPQQNPFTSYSNVYASTITSKPFHHNHNNSSNSNSTKITPGHLYKSPVIPGFFPNENDQTPANVTKVGTYVKTQNSSKDNGTDPPPQHIYQSSFVAGFFPNQDNNSNSQRPQATPPIYYQVPINGTQPEANITKAPNPYNIAFQTLLQQGNRTGRPRRPDPIAEFMANFFGLTGRNRRSVDSNNRNLLRISKDNVASKFIAPKYFPKFADYELPERRHTLPKYILNKDRRGEEKMDRVSLRDLFNKDFSRGTRNRKEMRRFVGSFEQIL